MSELFICTEPSKSQGRVLDSIPKRALPEEVSKLRWSSTPHHFHPLIPENIAQWIPFAECQVCHESWVWVQDSQKWVNARRVQKGAKRKASTQEPEDAQDRIGKLY